MRCFVVLLLVVVSGCAGYGQHVQKQHLDIKITIKNLDVERASKGTAEVSSTYSLDW